MKGIRIFLIAMIMVLLTPTTVFASNTKVSIADVEAERSQMVYLSVVLSDCKKANTLGISMKYDSNVLKKVAGECSWEKKGILQDFSKTKDDGVWTAKKAEDVNGKICTLAFRVKANAPIGESDVTCEVIVKEDSNVIGTYTATGTVKVIGKSETVTQPEDSDSGQLEDSDKEPAETTKPESSEDKNPQVSTQGHKGEATKQDSKDTENNSSETIKQENVSEIVENDVEEHVHTEEYDHALLEENSEQPKDNVSAYVWVCILLITLAVLGFVWKRIKTNRK